MTMQTPHSPKPKIFGDGYGKHLAYNYGLVKLFFKLGLKVLINAIVPGVYYERAHWGVIELYHKMSGYRHGTFSNHRCKECGSDLPSSDEMCDKRQELKNIEAEIDRIEEFDRIKVESDQTNLEEYQNSK